MKISLIGPIVTLLVLATLACVVRAVIIPAEKSINTCVTTCK